MGGARRDRGTLAAREQRVYEIDVPAGTTLLTARVRSADGGDLDLYLFDCTGKECVAARADGDASGDESARVLAPTAGRWKAVVDHSGLPTAPLSFDYQDVIFNPAERRKRGLWSARAHRWQATLPAGRTAHAAMAIQTQPKGGDPFVISVRELGGERERATPDGRSERKQ
jgi:hypothetical protein